MAEKLIENPATIWEKFKDDFVDHAFKQEMQRKHLLPPYNLENPA